MRTRATLFAVGIALVAAPVALGACRAAATHEDEDAASNEAADGAVAVGGEDASGSEQGAGDDGGVAVDGPVGATHDASVAREAGSDGAPPPVLDAASSLEADAPPASVPDGGLWIDDGACPTGAVGATFMNVPAYCQPTGSSGLFQCDELANRFMRDALHHPNLDNVVTDDASSICDHAAAMPAYSVWGPGYRDSTGYAPVPGDLVVYPGSPGHVAVIAGFADPATVTIVQQNGDPTVTTIPWNAAISFFDDDSSCWVHAEPAPPAPLPSGPPCGCFVDGPVCGLALVDYAWWNGCSVAALASGVDAQGLYACSGGVFTETTLCPDLCVTNDISDLSGACGP
ncbi:MAG TPA: CHAP domain-containing protein [Polyangiaceae bacterium]